MAGIHTLSDVKKYLKDNSFSITDDRIEKCYNFISNPENRVNSDDKQWVAITQDSEKKTVVDAIKKILDDNSTRYSDDTIMEQITIAVNEIGRLFQSKGIVKKPRIPFYVLVLHKLLS